MGRRAPSRAYAYRRVRRGRRAPLTRPDGSVLERHHSVRRHDVGAIPVAVPAAAMSARAIRRTAIAIAMLAAVLYLATRRGAGGWPRGWGRGEGVRPAPGSGWRFGGARFFFRPAATAM